MRPMAIGLSSLLAVFFLGGAAQAGELAPPEFEVAFTAIGGVPIEPPVDTLTDLAVGQIVTATLTATAGAGGLGSYSTSVEFDNEGNKIVNLETAANAMPPEFAFFPSVPDWMVNSAPGMGGIVKSIAAAGFPGNGIAEGVTVVAGTIDFEMANIGTTVIQPGWFNDGVDGCGYQDLQDCTTADFLGSTLTVTVPEAGSGPLQLAALGAVAFLVHRRRSA